MLALVLEKRAPASEAPLLVRDLGRPEPGPDEISCALPRAAFAAPTCR
ncbi:MAG: hypothetical protein M3Q31_00010 [Actinomycetota bacterium]|nr:hypothetical protein [Actinomycetota bacterium]